MIGGSVERLHLLLIDSDFVLQKVADAEAQLPSPRIIRDLGLLFL